MQHIRVTVLSILCVLISFPVHADDFNFSTMGSGWVSSMERIIAGTKKWSPKSLLCVDVKHKFLIAELKKAEFNHIFHELISEDQIPEIATLKKKIDLHECGTQSGSLEIFKLWVAYDEKWYAKIRGEKEAEKERLIEQWKSEIVPNNDDKWDGVINGIFLSIPRNHIWFGSHNPDGYQKAMNLQFFYPDMEARPTEGSNVRGPTNIAGVLKAEFSLTLPCFGFEGKSECTRKSFHVSFITKYLDCYGYKKIKEDADRPYRGIWQRQCGFMENYEFDKQPFFDEDLQMWRIGDAGYYKGDPEFPDEWFICKKPKDFKDATTLRQNQCYSAMSFGHGLSFSYTYPRHLFWEQQEVHHRIKKKIESFVVKITDERNPL